MEQAGSKSKLPAAAISALQRGNKIEAIKIVRNEHGLDLKDSKDLVDAYLRTQPAIQAGIYAARKESGRRALWWVAIVVGGAILAYLLLTRQ